MCATVLFVCMSKYPRPFDDSVVPSWHECESVYRRWGISNCTLGYCVWSPRGQSTMLLRSLEASVRPHRFELTHYWSVWSLRGGIQTASVASNRNFTKVNCWEMEKVKNRRISSCRVWADVFQTQDVQRPTKSSNPLLALLDPVMAISLLN